MTSPAADRQKLVFLSQLDSKVPLPGLETIGKKGLALAELARIGAPVPAGFALTAAACERFLRAEEKSDGRGGEDGAGELAEELERGLAHLGELAGRRFGDDKNPLLVSLRTSAPEEMPGELPAIVNFGLTEAGVKGLIGKTLDERAAWDAYRRFLRGFGEHVLGVGGKKFQKIVAGALERSRSENEHELEAAAMKDLAKAFLALCQNQGETAFPASPKAQLMMAVGAGFRAWQNPAAIARRAAATRAEYRGTALILQEMVFGNATGSSGAGSIFTRHPRGGEKARYGKFLPGGYGSDLTAGQQLPEEVAALEATAPEAFAELLEWAEKAERRLRDAQEIRFAVQQGRLWILRARPSGRTAHASLKIALDLVDEGICSERQALLTIDPAGVDRLLHPTLDKSNGEKPISKGLPASPGSAVGRAVFFAEHASELAEQGIKTILVRHETTPEDIGGLNVAEGILTGTGGLTSHAAVVARGMGKCCVVGATELEINYHVNEMTVGEVTVKKMDWISLDGNTGEIFAGELPQISPAVEGDLARVLEWADKARTIGVRANADTEEDARRALELGAEGIGLCRTEHMFFHIDRIPIFRKMILAVDEIGRSAALGELLPLQRKDFMDLLRVMDGRPLTIRLLDPPLNEFLPRGIRSQTRMSRAMKIPLDALQRRIEVLSETNPMLGHRGCRLALTYPEIYQMQVRAIVEAACIVTKEGVPVLPEIMVPLVSTSRELEVLRREIEQLAGRVMEELGETVPLTIGTMLETPRAAMCSASIARHADFYSFGTNDLTQMGYGFSRDDAGSFLPLYLEKGVLEHDPFVTLDQEGIGEMVRMAIQQGRQQNPKLKFGICGEHGGEPESVKFFHRLGLDYVSCSPFRLPVARLAAAQGSVEDDPAQPS